VGERLKGAIAAVSVAAALVVVGSASADRSTLASNTVAPWWGGAAVVTPLEALAGRIATRIAGHQVTVRCETASRFRSLAGSRDVSGFVHTVVDPRTGRYAATATVIELTSQVCGPLQRFAAAAIKPTRCTERGQTRYVPCFVGTPVARGSAGASICWSESPSCYRVASYSGAYWDAYGDYASAIQTLAHEAIHTFQAQAGRLRPQGNLVEQQAECYGMQWMPWVATQLGDSGADPQRIATYFWLGPYRDEASRLPAYWSSDCKPGGALDVRGAGSRRYWP
jgi:hypothetical protein